MKERKNRENEFVKISENTTVVYKNGNIEIFDAVQIMENGVTTGHIIDEREFEEGGFIPKNNIKKIIRGSNDKQYVKKQIGKIFLLLIINILFFYKI